MKMRKNDLKWISLPILTIIIMIGLAGTTLAECLWVTPANASTLSGSDVNISVRCGEEELIAECDVFGISTMTGSTVHIVLSNDTSVVPGINVWDYYNFSSINVESRPNSSLAWRDADDWAFTVNCTGDNATVKTDITTKTGITVNSSTPSISGCTIEGESAANGTISDSTFDFVCTIANASYCNMFWKDTNPLDLNGGSDDDTSCGSFNANSSWSGTGSGTSVTCTLHGAGDVEKDFYINCTDPSRGDRTTGPVWSVTAEGDFNPDNGDGDDDIFDWDFTWIDDKDNILLIAVAAFVLIIIGVIIASAKKKK